MFAMSVKFQFSEQKEASGIPCDVLFCTPPKQHILQKSDL